MFGSTTLYRSRHSAFQQNKQRTKNKGTVVTLNSEGMDSVLLAVTFARRTRA
jgi:hypothetical protein